MTVAPDQKTFKFLKKHGYEMGELLGEGCEGYVYKVVNYNGLVVKITESHKEYDFFSYLKKLKSKAPPFFPKVRQVYKLHLNCHYPYIVVREDIKDLDKRTYKKLYNDFESLGAVGGDEWKTTKFKSGHKNWFNKIRHWCIRHKWMLNDLNEDNIGIRRKHSKMLVIRDLGLCSRDIE